MMLTLRQNLREVFFNARDANSPKSRLFDRNVHGVENRLTRGRHRACCQRGVRAPYERWGPGLHEQDEIEFIR